VHGDPLPVNVVFPDGTLSGVIADFDDMSAGDPVCGLAAAWLVLLAGRRLTLLRRPCASGRGHDPACPRAGRPGEPDSRSAAAR